MDRMLTQSPLSPKRHMRCETLRTLRTSREITGLAGSEKSYIFRDRVDRALFCSAMDCNGEHDFGSVRYVSQFGRPVELHVRIVALDGCEGGGFGFAILRPTERYGVAQFGVERKISSRSDDCQRLFDLAALHRTYIHERIDLWQNACVAHIRPTELVHIRLQFLESLNANAQFVGGRELIVLADRSCEFGMNPKPVVERDGFTAQPKVLDAFDESVKRTFHVLELSTDESVIQRELHYLVEVVRFAFRDLGTLAALACLWVVAADDAIFQLRLYICHSYYPLFMFCSTKPTGCHPASCIIGKVSHLNIAETAKFVTRNLRKVLIPSGGARGNEQLRAICATSRLSGRRAYGSSRQFGRQSADGNPSPTQQQCLSRYCSGMKIRGGTLEARRYSPWAQIRRNIESIRRPCLCRKTVCFLVHRRFRRAGSLQGLMRSPKIEDASWRVPSESRQPQRVFPLFWPVHQAYSHDYLVVSFS